MLENNTKEKYILFVLNDNDPVLVRVLKNKFEKDAGWKSVITNSYSEAMLAVKEKDPDAVMTEIIINDESGKTGFDLISEIRTIVHKMNMPIIVFSDLGQEEDKQKAITVGATHYFVKSEISLLDLIQKIKEIIGK